MTEINTFPIQQFIQMVKSADMTHQKEIRMDIKSAKALMYSISEINNQLVADFSAIMNKKDEPSEKTISVNMDGGDFKG